VNHPDSRLTLGDDDVPASLRRAWRESHLVPLWESPTAHKLEVDRERAHLWPWATMRPIIEDTLAIRSPAVVERRVLSLVNPRSKLPEDEATTGSINACLQAMLPGEHARPHRHSMNALRFVLEGEGGETVVDDRVCRMHPGDLVITPAWTWHEHRHQGQGPVVWMDVLDVALHLYFGTDDFHPGPIRGELPPITDAMFAVPGIVPEGDPPEGGHSPLFRYAWSDAVRALDAALPGTDGLRRVRYTSPLTGGPCMTTLDCHLVGIAPGVTSSPQVPAWSTVCCVAEGEGESDIGGVRIEWKARDIFTVPRGAVVSHTAGAAGARLFTVDNREVYSRLGLLRAAPQTGGAR
jgi:gentisate 1,2-dioxygenase